MYPSLQMKRTRIYWPQRSCGQGNIFTPVCHSFCSQGGSASVHAGIPPEQTPPWSRHPPEQTSPRTRPPGADTPGSRHPPEQTPPGPDTPPDQIPPGSRLQHMVYERPVRILLECILVAVKFPSNLVPLRNWAEPFTGVMSLQMFTVRKHFYTS